jgi:hypothetical protein
MIIINDSQKTLQERFLEDIANELKVEGINKYVIMFRYNPDNYFLTHANIADKIDQEYKFNLANINTYISRIADAIINRFADKIKQDSITIERSNQRGRPNEEFSPYKITYKWLWEKEFPRRAWDLAKEIAKLASTELRMVSSEIAKSLDISEFTDLIDDDYSIKSGNPYHLSIKFPYLNHYLLLINENIDGQKVLLSPSKIIADIPFTQLSEELVLPLNDEKRKRIPYLRYKGEGIEYFLALITEQPIELSWISELSRNDDYFLDQNRLEEIFNKISKQRNSQLFYKQFNLIQ